MEKTHQFKLSDFDGKPEKSLTMRVVGLVLAGKNYKDVARLLGLKKKQNVAYYVSKAKKLGLIEKAETGVWISGTEVVKTFQEEYPVVKTLRASISGSGVPVLGPRWSKHNVQSWFPIRSTVEWARVRGLAHGVNDNLGFPQFYFNFGDVRLRVCKTKVEVTVHGLNGSTWKGVELQAWERAKQPLADFMVSAGVELGESQGWRCRGTDWVLRRDLSEPLLRLKPDLADATHPEQVEVTEQAKNEIEALLDGSLRSQVKADLTDLARSVNFLTLETQKAVNQQVDVALLLQDIQTRLERIERKLGP